MTTLPTPAELDRLRELEKAATPGPWHSGHNPDGYDPIDYFRDAYAFGPPGRIHLTCIPVPGKDVNDEALFTAITGNGPTSEANARLLAELRNAAPSLLLAASTAITLEAFLREHGPRIRSLLEIKATLTEDQTQAHHWQAALDALSELLATLAKETKDG